MFKLIRLAVYALVGYAVYQFVSDVMNAVDEAHAPARPKSASRAQGARATGGKRRAGGKTVSTHDADGASSRHRVGRGAV